LASQETEEIKGGAMENTMPHGAMENTMPHVIDDDIFPFDDIDADLFDLIRRLKTLSDTERDFVIRMTCEDKGKAR